MYQLHTGKHPSRLLGKYLYGMPLVQYQYCCEFGDGEMHLKYGWVVQKPCYTLEPVTT